MHQPAPGQPVGCCERAPVSGPPANAAMRVFLIMFVTMIFSGAVLYYQGGKDAKVSTPCPAVSK